MSAAPSEPLESPDPPRHRRRRIVVVVFALALVALGAVLFRPGDELPMCVPDSELATAASETDAPTQRPHAWAAALPPSSAGLPASTTILGRAGVPLFAQNSGPWADSEYARSAGLPAFDCGRSVEQCGCAMTSLANIISLFGVVSTPEESGGASLDPGSFNSWLNRHAQYHPGQGWISDGYYLGLVVWSDIAPFTEALRRAHPELHIPAISYRGVGTGREAEIRSELRAGRPVILEVPGHYIAAVGFDSVDDVVIHDPFFPERQRLSTYPSPVLSSRLFDVGETSEPALLIMAPPGLRLQVSDAQGKVTGTLDTDGNIAWSAGDGAPQEIPGSAFAFESAWSDPNCTGRAPRAFDGATEIFIRSPNPGLTVRILDPGRSAGCVAIYRYDASGAVRVERICDRGGAELFTRALTDPPAPRVAGPPPATPVAEPTPSPSPPPLEDPVVPALPSMPPTTGGSGGAPSVTTPSCEPALLAVGGSIRCVVLASSPSTWSASGTKPSGASGALFEATVIQAGPIAVNASSCNTYGCTVATLTMTAVAKPVIACDRDRVFVGDRISCRAEGPPPPGTFARWALRGIGGHLSTEIGPSTTVTLNAEGMVTLAGRTCSLAGCVETEKTLRASLPEADSSSPSAPPSHAPPSDPAPAPPSPPPPPISIIG